MDSMTSTLEYLKEKEWSLGNGQCPECYGVPYSWYGHHLYRAKESIGRENDCKFAKMMSEIGINPLLKGQFETDIELEPRNPYGCSEEIWNRFLDNIANECDKSILELQESEK